MANVLVVAEQQSGTLKKATLHALGAGSELARRLGGKLYVLVAGKGVGQVAEELRAYADVLVADAPVLEHYLAESYAPGVADAARAAQADHLCAAATAFGKDLLPTGAGPAGPVPRPEAGRHGARRRGARDAREGVPDSSHRVPAGGEERRAGQPR